MGSVCCRRTESPRVDLGQVISRWTQHFWPTTGNPLKVHQNVKMEKEEKKGEERKSGGAVKREVSFAEPEGRGRNQEGTEERVEGEGERPPEPPPRRNRRRRLSKSRRAVTFGGDSCRPPEERKGGKKEEEEEEEEEEELPPSRLPELLRRDTFCDALDFRLYTAHGLPGRRASSLDGLYWEEEGEEEEGVSGEEGGLSSWRSLEGVSRGVGPRREFLRSLLQPSPSPNPSMSPSLREFESSILDMLTAREGASPPPDAPS